MELGKISLKETSHMYLTVLTFHTAHFCKENVPVTCYIVQWYSLAVQLLKPDQHQTLPYIEKSSSNWIVP
jgi:hypothetical protein